MGTVLQDKLFNFFFKKFSYTLVQTQIKISYTLEKKKFVHNVAFHLSCLQKKLYVDHKHRLSLLFSSLLVVPMTITNNQVVCFIHLKTSPNTEIDLNLKPMKFAFIPTNMNPSLKKVYSQFNKQMSQSIEINVTSHSRSISYFQK
jgi:hypothetical protein